jgi:hypothetical protein
MRVDPALVVTHELPIADLPSFLGTADYSWDISSALTPTLSARSY